MKLVYDKGFNDLKTSSDKFYRTWANMLARCYYDKFQERYPNYIGCAVCKDWLTYSKFKTWMESQDWEGKCLDKDLICKGNKLYSPETCVFIPQELNKFLIENETIRGLYPIGVYFKKSSNKFASQCRVKGELKFLGYFDTPDEAHKAWKSKKREIALEYASNQIDARIAKAILERYPQ